MRREFRAMQGELQREASVTTPRSFKRQWPLVASLALSVALTLGAAPALSAATDVLPADEVLFSLPVGHPLAYSGIGPEQLTWGPAAIAVGDDGKIWIADGAGHRVIAFDRAGAKLLVVDVSPWVTGLGGIALFDDKLVVLDIASMHPTVVVLEQATGNVVRIVSLPPSAQLEHGLSGVAILPDGTVAAELEGGTRLVAVARLSRSSAQVERIESRSTTYHTEAAHVRILDGPAGRPDGHGTVEIGSKQVTLRAANMAGTIKVVGATADAVYLTFDEVTQRPDGTLLVDTTVRALDTNGRLLGMARVPLADMAARPQQPVAVSKDGDVIALVPREATIDVVHLALKDRLATVLPALDPPKPMATGLEVGMTSCVYRSTMSSTDSAYRSNSKYLSSTNISGACSGRTKPRYLGGAGTYGSVPYQWGGFSTVSQFNSNMSPNTGRAGDINSSATLSCAHGVDCSGFVSRVWQLTSKYGTWTLPNISSAIPASSMQANDIFNLAGSHTILFKSKSGNGYYVSESTTASSYDRVIYRWISSSYVSSYSTRRYHNVCCNPNVEVCPVSGTTTGGTI